MSPKHPADPLLAEYLRDSRPPPGYASARERLERRLEGTTGVHNLAELESGMREQFALAANKALADRLAEERDNSKRTSDRIWQVLLAVLLIIITVVLARAGFK